MIKEHPIIGFGTDGFEREYMLRQADYFRNNPSSRYNMLADDMQHPLNEFVYLWVNYGIFAPLLLLVSLTLPLFVYIHKRNTDGMWASLLYYLCHYSAFSLTLFIIRFHGWR